MRHKLVTLLLISQFAIDRLSEILEKTNDESKREDIKKQIVAKKKNYRD